MNMVLGSLKMRIALLPPDEPGSLSLLIPCQASEVPGKGLCTCVPGEGGMRCQGGVFACEALWSQCRCVQMLRPWSFWLWRPHTH